MLTFIYYKRREINLKSLNHLINSSILMAYLICLGWSIAYVCGWARAYYYGYSWELVEVGTSNIARSLGYVVFFSIIITIFYSCGMYVLHLVKKILSTGYYTINKVIYCSNNRIIPNCSCVVSLYERDRLHPNYYLSIIVYPNFYRF